MNKEEEWQEFLDNLEDESELDFEEDNDEDFEKKDPSFYASRLQLIEEAAKRVKRR
jgi:hypothetical protein